MTVQSDDGRLVVTHYDNGTRINVFSRGLLTAQQVYDALLPLLPPPVPTARQVAEAAVLWSVGDSVNSLVDIARRWDEGGRP